MISIYAVYFIYYTYKNTIYDLYNYNLFLLFTRSNFDNNTFFFIIITFTGLTFT